MVADNRSGYVYWVPLLNLPVRVTLFSRDHGSAPLGMVLDSTGETVLPDTPGHDRLIASLVNGGDRDAGIDGSGLILMRIDGLEGD